MHKTMRTILAVLLLAAMLLPTAALAKSYGAKVCVSSMTVYTKGKKAVASLGRGKKITVTGIKGSWIRFTYKGSTGYAHLGDVVFNKRVKAVTSRDTQISCVTKASWKKGEYYKATLTAGSEVYICGKKGSKYLITNDTRSAYGYISTSAVQKL